MLFLSESVWNHWNSTTKRNSCRCLFFVVFLACTADVVVCSCVASHHTILCRFIYLGVSIKRRKLTLGWFEWANTKGMNIIEMGKNIFRRGLTFLRIVVSSWYTIGNITCTLLLYFLTIFPIDVAFFCFVALKFTLYTQLKPRTRKRDRKREIFSNAPNSD